MADDRATTGRPPAAPACLPATLRGGMIPQYEGTWTPAAIRYARVMNMLPLSSPVMDQVDQRYPQHFVEQDAGPRD